MNVPFLESLPYDICIFVVQTSQIRSRLWVSNHYTQKCLVELFNSTAVNCEHFQTKRSLVKHSKDDLKIFPLIYQIFNEYSHSKFHMADVSMRIPNSEDCFVQAKATCNIKLHAGLLHKFQWLQPTLLTFHYITFKYLSK